MEQEFASLLNPELLKTLRSQFELNPREKDVLNHTEFRDLFINKLAPDAIETLLKNVDINMRQYITWDDFSNYLIASFNDEASCVYIDRLVGEKLSTINSRRPYGGIHYSPVNNTIQESLLAYHGSVISVFNPNTMNHIKDITYANKISVHHESLSRIAVEDKAMLIKRTRTHLSSAASRPTSCITCLTVMPLTGHICIGASDNMVTVFEPQSSNNVCAAYALAFAPSCIYGYVFKLAVVEKGQERIESLRRLAVGDNAGNVSVFDFNLSSIAAMVKTVLPLPLLASRKCHSDRVTAIAYMHSFSESLVSTAVDGTMVYLNPQTLNKTHCFDANEAMRGRLLLAARGSTMSITHMDHSVDMKWIALCIQRAIVFVDPYNLKVVHVEESLTSQPCCLQINDALSHLVVACADKTIRLYHTASYKLLQYVTDSTEYMPNSLSSAYYDPAMSRFYTASNKILLWRVKKMSGEEVSFQHRLLQEPHLDRAHSDIVSCLFVSEFERVIIVERSGIVRTFAALTGKLLGYFSIVEKLLEMKYWTTAIPGFDCDAVPDLLVNTAFLDSEGKRMFVVSQTNVVTAWNYMSGLCLHCFCPLLANQVTTGALSSGNELGCCAYAEVPVQRADAIRYLFLSHKSTLQCHREVEDFKRTSTRHLSLPGSLENREVLWVGSHGTGYLVSSYENGSLVLWDLVHQLDDGKNYTFFQTTHSAGTVAHRRHSRAENTTSPPVLNSYIPSTPIVPMPSKAKEGARCLSRIVEQTTVAAGYVVTHGCFGKATNVLFGVCSDNVIRAWVLPEGALLVSHAATNSTDGDDELVLLDFVDDPALVAAAFESGAIKLFSFDTVQSRLETRYSLTLATKWQAHYTRIIAVRIFLSSDTSATELFAGGFVLTTGSDHNCFLWSTTGNCIGHYGPCSFSLHDSSSWANHAAATYESLSTTDTARNRRSSPRSLLFEVDKLLKKCAKARTEHLILKDELEESPSAGESVLIRHVMGRHPIVEVSAPEATTLLRRIPEGIIE